MASGTEANGISRLYKALFSVRFFALARLYFGVCEVSPLKASPWLCDSGTSMRETGNIETIRATYAAFNRGDIAGVLKNLDESIVFTTPGSTAVPMAGTRRGIEEVRRFFEDLERRMEFTVFDVRELLAQGNRVVALVHYEGRDRKTGRGFIADSAMLWTIGNGKAIRFQEYTDTEALAAAAVPNEIQALGAS